MDIEQKLEEIIGAKLMDGYQLERTFKRIIKSTTQAILSSPDIAVVEKVDGISTSKAYTDGPYLNALSKLSARVEELEKTLKYYKARKEE